MYIIVPQKVCSFEAYMTNVHMLTLLNLHKENNIQIESKQIILHEVL